MHINFSGGGIGAANITKLNSILANTAALLVGQGLQALDATVTKLSSTIETAQGSHAPGISGVFSAYQTMIAATAGPVRGLYVAGVIQNNNVANDTLRIEIADGASNTIGVWRADTVLLLEDLSFSILINKTFAAGTLFKIRSLTSSAANAGACAWGLEVWEA